MERRYAGHPEGSGHPASRARFRGILASWARAHTRERVVDGSTCLNGTMWRENGIRTGAFLFHDGSLWLASSGFSRDAEGFKFLRENADRLFRRRHSYCVVFLDMSPHRGGASMYTWEPHDLARYFRVMSCFAAFLVSRSRVDASICCGDEG